MEVKKDTDKNNKLSGFCLLFCFSVVNIFFGFEGSFTIQSLIPLICITIIFFLMRKESSLTVSKQVKILFLLNVEYSISFLVNVFRYDMNFYSVIQLIYQIVILVWYYLISKNKFTKKELVAFCNTIILVFVICGIYVLYQNLVLHKTIFSITTLFGNRIGKNHFSAWISLAITLSFYFLIYNKKKIKYLIPFLILVLSVVFMNSRGAILSSIFCCGLVILGYIFSNKVTLKKIAIVFSVIIILGFGCKVAVDIMPTWLYRRYFVKSYVDDSNLDRVYRWKNAFDGMAEHPILGFGPGVFSGLEEYQITDFGYQISTSTPSHNTFFDVALNGGIIAFIIFICFIYEVFISYFKKYRLYIPIIAHVMINSMILGTSKTVYFWDVLIFLTVLSFYLKNEKNDYNIFASEEKKSKS